MPRRAFTLVELLVVIAIIGLLSTVAIVALGQAQVGARNAKRKADMLQVSKALELYYEDHGAYPSTGAASNWRGNCSGFGGYPDADPANYPTTVSWIPGLTAGSYMSRLPRDPNNEKANPSSSVEGCRTSGVASCFLYTSTGIHYKLIAHCTPEGPWTSSDPFYDPSRVGHAWQVTDDKTATSGW
jgi:prepilin-type N-terminal cleavage/methylation domain-containing protein